MGLQAAVGLLQRQRMQDYLLRRAIEVKSQSRQLPWRPDLEAAFGVVFVRAAAGLELAVTGQHLASQFRRQFEAVPVDVQRGADRLGGQLHAAGGLHCSLDLRRAQLELLQGQGVVVAIELRAQRLQQQLVVVEIEPTFNAAAVAVAMTLHGNRRGLHRARSDQRFRIEARRIQLAGPGVVAALGQLQLQMHYGGCGELEIEPGLLAVAVRVEAAGVAGVIDFPRERSLAVALPAVADRQFAVEAGVAVGRLQRQLAQFDAAVGPAAGQVEPVGGEQRLAIPCHLHLAKVHAVENQRDRRLQRETAGAGGVVFGGFG